MTVFRDIGALMPETGTAESQGSMIHSYFDFNYLTPNIYLGVPFYIPDVGEYIYNIWTQIFTPWAAGLNPLALDVGIFFSSQAGWAEQAFSTGQNVNQQDTSTLELPAIGPRSGYNNVPDILSGGGFAAVSQGLQPQVFNPNSPSAWTNASNTIPGGGQLVPETSTLAIGWPLPAQFVTNHPIKVVVSQNGLAQCRASVLATNVVGFGVGGLPVTVTATNNTFRFGPAGSELTYTVANGTYSTEAAVVTAMNAALSGGIPLSNVATMYSAAAVNTFGKIVAVGNTPGTSQNGYDFLSGLANDFLAYSGFANAQALGGGSTPSNPIFTSGSARVNIITTHPILAA